MAFTIVAVAVGLVVGLVSGGRPRHLADKQIAGWPLLVAGLVLQAAVNRLPDSWSLAALLASYGALLLFGVLNLRLIGMPIVLVGLALNTFTIALNGGMSVRPCWRPGRRRPPSSPTSTSPASTTSPARRTS